MRPHLTVEQRQLALRLKAGGLSLRERERPRSERAEAVLTPRRASVTASGPRPVFVPSLSKGALCVAFWRSRCLQWS